jgi:hypothetical protein
MGWRHIAGICLLLSGSAAAGCATGADDSGTFPDDAAIGTDPDAPVTEAGDGGSHADSGSPTGVDSSTIDTAKPADTGTTMQADSTVVDSGGGIDSQVIDTALPDTGIPDVVIPDVAVPPGTTTCNYLGSAGDFAQYVAECLIFKSSASECSGGCAAGQCCGALCQNSSNQAVCLPQ